MVACGAPLTGEEPVRIGLPLDGWDLAVVDEHGNHVAPGETGELIIGGVGLARYLDPVKDAEKYAPFPTLGWERAYRSGDRVVYDEDRARLRRPGRRPGQAGWTTHRARRGRQRPARPPGTSRVLPRPYARARAGNQLLVGYVTRRRGLRRLERRWSTSAPSCPLRWCRGSRRWPPCRPAPPARSTATLCPGRWPPRRPTPPQRRTCRAPRPGSPTCGSRSWEPWSPTPSDDFFDLGGGSLTAAQMVSRLRTRYPEVTVADLYEHPTVRGLAALLDGMAAPTIADQPAGPAHAVEDADRPDRLHRPAADALGSPVGHLGGVRATTSPPSLLGLTYLPTVSWWWVLVGWLAPGRGSWPDGAHGRGRTLPAAQRPARGSTRAGAASTCGCGWPSVSPTSSAPPTWREPPGCPPTRACWVPRWASGSTCTRSRRSPGCSPWAAAARWSPRSTCPATGSTATCCTSVAIKVASGARVGTRSTLCPGAVVGSRRRGRTGVGGGRHGHEGRVLDGLAGRAGGPDPWPVVASSVRRTSPSGWWRTPPSRP